MSEFVVIVEGGFAERVRLPDQAAADAYVRQTYGEDECYATQVTPELRRAMRNADRRDRYAETEHRSRAKPVSAEAMAWYAGIGMMAQMSMYDENGRLRCPDCRRFATLDSFAGSPTAASGGAICIDFGPSCRRCRGVGDV